MIPKLFPFTSRGCLSVETLMTSEHNERRKRSDPCSRRTQRVRQFSRVVQELEIANSKSSGKRMTGLYGNAFGPPWKKPIMPLKIVPHQFVLPCNFRTLTADRGRESIPSRKPYPSSISQSPAFLRVRSHSKPSAGILLSADSAPSEGPSIPGRSNQFSASCFPPRVCTRL